MRIGIIGAGQLGQMLGFAARDLGVECRFVDPSDSPPAADCGEVIQKPFDDADALAELAATCDVMTYEFENVPVEALHKIEGKVPVYPPADALRHCSGSPRRETPVRPARYSAARLPRDRHARRHGRGRRCTRPAAGYQDAPPRL